MLEILLILTAKLIKYELRLIFYCLIMKISIYGYLAFLLLISMALAQGDDATTLTYFVDYEE